MSDNGHSHCFSNAASAEELRETDEMYRLLVECSRDHAIFMLDAQGRVMSWNTGAGRLKGYSEAEIRGQHFSCFYTEEARNAHDPEHNLKRAAALGRFEDEGWRVRKDGSRFWANVVITAIRNNAGELLGFGKVTSNLSPRKQVEAALQASRERYRSLLKREQRARAEAEASEDRVIFLAEASRVLAASLDYQETLRQVVRMAVPRLGDYCLVDVVEEDGSIHRVEVCHADPDKEQLLREMQRKYPLDGSRTHPALQVLRSGELVFIPEAGEDAWERLAHDAEHLAGLRVLRPCSYIGVPLQARERMLGVLSFVSSDPERRYGAAELATAEELARRAAVAVDNARLYRAAVVANRSKADFLATMSHELRTPLNAIIGYASLLRDGITGPVTEAQQKQLGRIEGSSRHLLHLIEEVLGYARMEAGKEEVSIEEFELSELVEGVAALVEPLAHEKGLLLEAHAPVPPFVLETDAGKVRQVLVNLLSNAIKFTDRGRVHLEADIADRSVVFRVSDTGIGIPAEHLESIFYPFFQVDQGTARRAGGTGLGLAVTRHLVHLLDGEISVSSPGGSGTTVTVLLPARIRGGAAASQ